MLSPEEALAQSDGGAANTTLSLLPLLLFPTDCPAILNASDASVAALCFPSVPPPPASPSASPPPPPPWTTAPSASTHRRGPRHPMMAWWQQLAWSALFALMLVVAIGGNAIVMWIVLAHRRMRTVTNYFLVNLSVADLFMAIFNCIFNFVYMLNNDWYFGRPYCSVSNFIANVSVAASVFTLTGISVDRMVQFHYKPSWQQTVALRCDLVTRTNPL